MQWVVRLLAVFFVCAVTASAQGPQRLALVIGNAAYTAPGWALTNPVNDATLIANRLKPLGFDVTFLPNATKVQMEEAMNSFGARLRGGGADAVGVFYYAGHGVEHDGANLLVPVDVSARTLDELRFQAPPMQFVLRDMARAGNAVNIVVLDACRNLPLPSGTRTGPAGGLAELDESPPDVLIAYATRAGFTAPDNPGESNSVFTRTLAEALASNAGDTVVNLFSQVQADVFVATGRLQRPEFRSGLLRAPGFRLAAAPAQAPGRDKAMESELRRAREQIANLQRERERAEAAQKASRRNPSPSIVVQPALKKVALIIANASYGGIPMLPDVQVDGRAVANALRRAGFDMVIMEENADAMGMRRALANFSESADADVALVYFAGFGLQNGGVNWLLPVDARVESADQLSFQAIGIDLVAASVSKARTKLIVLDASRNNPFGGRIQRARGQAERGLGQVEAPLGTLVMFAASPGNTSSDGPIGQGSPFGRAFARGIGAPGVELQFTTASIADSVFSETGGMQRPWISSNLSGEPLVLVPR